MVSTVVSSSRPGKRKGAGIDDTVQDKVNELGGSAVALAMAAGHTAQGRRQRLRTEVMAPPPIPFPSVAPSSSTRRGELGQFSFFLFSN
jgi:hypothetical protein